MNPAHASRHAARSVIRPGWAAVGVLPENRRQVRPELAEPIAEQVGRGEGRREVVVDHLVDGTDEVGTTREQKALRRAEPAPRQNVAIRLPIRVRSWLPPPEPPD